MKPPRRQEHADSSPPSFDAEELRAYLKAKAKEYSREGFPEEAAGMRDVLDDLFPEDHR